MSVRSPSATCRPDCAGSPAPLSILARVERRLHGRAQIGRAHRDVDTGGLKSCDLVGRSAVPARNNRSRMTHPPTLRRSLPGYECDHGLLKVLLDVVSRLFFCSAADLTNENDRVGAGVLVKQFQHVDLVGPDYRVAADSDAGRLPDAELG